VNGGIFGFTAKPYLLTSVLKALKRTGCLPYSVSITFSISDRKVYIYMDAGRPLRPLVCISNATVPVEKLRKYPTWRDLVMGNLEIRRNATIESTEFVDPLEGKSNKLEDYPDALLPHTGAIEYVDPYEQNETFIANNPAYIKPETTHMEVHASTIMSMMTTLIPFSPHNQSPRNQLSCSQSKQGLSIYATNWRNRFDNTAHVLCYGEMPLTRTIYNNYWTNWYPMAFMTLLMDVKWGRQVAKCNVAKAAYERKDPANNPKIPGSKWDGIQKPINTWIAHQKWTNDDHFDLTSNSTVLSSTYYLPQGITFGYRTRTNFDATQLDGFTFIYGEAGPMYYENIHSCATHPHNFLLQLLAEVGIFGFFIVFLFFYFLIFYLKKINKKFYSMSFYYLPLIIFTFPFLPNGNFFNNWLSMVSYLNISLSIYLLFIKNEKNKNSARI